MPVALVHNSAIPQCVELLERSARPFESNQFSECEDETGLRLVDSVVVEALKTI